jgi:hypothetical protein
MKTSNVVKVLLRASLCVFLAGLVSLGLFSVASADRGPVQASYAAPAASPAPAATPAQPQASQADDQQCPSDDAAQAPAASALELSTQIGTNPCGSGASYTCCSCGCACREDGISPQNFCKFYLCV